MTSKEFLRPATTMNSQRNPKITPISMLAHRNLNENDFFQEMRPFSSSIGLNKKSTFQPGFPKVFNVSTISKEQSNVYDTPIQNMNKKKPKNIPQDKEKLYEETIHLKAMINTMNQEINKLRTRNLILEAALLIYLRKQLKEDKFEIVKKDNELTLLKKNFKYTKINELEVEIKTQGDELFRLRNMLQQALKINSTTAEGNISLEEKYLIQMNTINTLKKDNVEMAAIIKKMEEDLYISKQKNQELERSNQKNLKEKNLMKKFLNERERDHEKRHEENEPGIYKQKLPNQADIQPTLEVIQLKQELDKKSNENNQLSNNVKQKETKVNELEKKIKEIHREYQEKLNQELKEKQMIIAKNEKERNEYNDLIEKYQILAAQKSSFDNFSSLEAKNIKLKSNTDLGNANEKKMMLPDSKKKLSKINSYEVEMIGTEIKFGMQLKRIPIEEIEQFLFTSEIVNKKKASISELESILKEEPFNVRNEKNLLLVSRYLIENNEEDHVILDFNRTCETLIIKTRFKKLIGNYSLLSVEEEKTIYDRISTHFLKFKQGLIDTLKDLNIKRKLEEGYSKDYFNLQDLSEALKFIEADFSVKEKDYLKMQLFKETFELNKLELNSVMRIFDGSNFDKNCTFHTAEILSPKAPTKKNLVFKEESQMLKDGVIEDKTSGENEYEEKFE